MSAIATIIGFVPRAVEYGVTNAGKEKASFSLCAYGYKDNPFWIKVMVFEGRLNHVLAYVKEGTSLMVTGRLCAPDARMKQDGTPTVSMTLFASDISLIPRSNRTSDDGPSVFEKVKSPSSMLDQQLGAGSGTDDDLPF